jgi:NAD(P)-dependent dehydrogenase (short-subunit alcohol dehydrogenase family)
MRRQGAGTIVQVGSALAYRSVPLQSAYCAAKAAARAFTDSLRSELIHERSPIRLTMVHLPAVNTPQFDWARSRLPRRLQPVPPIHAPEVAAEAVYAAARDAPRELWVGTPTVQAIAGTMIAPGVLDRVLAQRGWEGQMTDEPAAVRADNLFEPVDEDRGARGRFTPRERGGAMAASAAVLRGGAYAATIACAAGLIALARRSPSLGNLSGRSSSNRKIR